MVETEKQAKQDVILFFLLQMSFDSINTPDAKNGFHFRPSVAEIFHFYYISRGYSCSPYDDVDDYDDYNNEYGNDDNYDNYGDYGDYGDYKK